MKLRRLLSYKNTRLILLTVLPSLGMISLGGCEHVKTIHNNYNTLLKKTIPPFPQPSPEVADELSKACPDHKCEALFEWIRRLKILQEQLELYEHYDD